VRLMVTIKGGLKFERGKPLPDKFVKEIGGTILPFKATGWKSTKGMDAIPENFKKKTKIKKIIVKKKESVESVAYTEESLREMKFSELREFAKGYGVKARSRDEFIKELKEKGVVGGD